MNEFLKRAKEIQPDTIKVRRKIHEFGGVGFELRESANLIIDELKKIGIKPSEIVPCGITCTIGKGGGKTILLRADFDALPMDERTGLPFANTKGSCHSCGHDLHGASLLAAARLLKERENEIEGTVKLMFQPSEETLAGANAMIKAGILENPKVDAALAIHIGSGSENSYPGRVSVVRGACYASGDKVTITVKGVGGHGAYTHTTVDPVSIASHIVIALHEIQARELPANSMNVISFGYINGGTAANIIPETVTLMGTIRATDRQVRQTMLTRVKEIAENVAKTFRAEAIVEYSPDRTPALINNIPLADEYAQYFKKTVGEENVFTPNTSTSFGSEDFAYICEEVPAVMISVGAGAQKDGFIYPMHNPQVMFDEEGLAYSAAIYASTAFEWLKNNK